MKILFHIHSLAGGGAERVWAILASDLVRQGEEVVMTVNHLATANLALLDPKVRLVTLGGGHLLSTFALAAFLRRERPDVSISALGSSNLKHVVAALLVGRLDRAIISYHGYVENEPRLLSRLSFRLTPLLTRLSALTVAVSASLAEVMVSRYGAAADRIVTILNPVAAPDMSVDEAGLAARPPMILAVCRLDPAKNVAFLIRAFAAVNRPDARLVVIGEGDERPALEAEIAQLGLGGRVELAGYQPIPWPWYLGARVFATSSKVEAFGLNVVEALAAGLPVVSTACGGPREILDLDGVAAALDEGRATCVACGDLGWLIAHGEEAAFARALEMALDAPGRPEPRIERAHAFSVRSAVDRYLANMRRVADSARSPGSTR